jgi:pyridoxamine 5'-phosphate oxidase
MDPFEEFRARFALAEGVSRGQLPEPNAMVLSTVSADGTPSARVVLLKGLDERGFVFYTNLDSRKGAELAADPRCALVFHWAPIEWQVRVEGRAERVTDAEADAYFATRARESQIGAWASRQSAPLADDKVLDARVSEMVARFAGGAVPRPPHWSGFRVVPSRIEFWHGRAHRLHERRVFERGGNAGAWTMHRLFP